MPGRDRIASEAAVRHRAGRAPGRIRAGRAGRADRVAAGLLAGEASLGGRLVHPAAARVLADLRGARRRTARRPAQPPRRRAGQAGQGGVGGGGVRRRWSRFGGLPPKPRADPWRRTSGIHRVRGARALSRVRALWYARDAVAARRDSAPGRVLADAAIIAAAEMDPRDERSLLLLPGFGGRSVRRLAKTWLDALDEARDLTERRACRCRCRTTVRRRRTAGPSAIPRPPSALARARAAVNAIAAERNLPPENLITPDLVRRVAWEPPADGLPSRSRPRCAPSVRASGRSAWSAVRSPRRCRRHCRGQPPDAASRSPKQQTRARPGRPPKSQTRAPPLIGLGGHVTVDRPSAADPPASFRSPATVRESSP